MKDPDPIRRVLSISLQRILVLYSQGHAFITFLCFLALAAVVVATSLSAHQPPGTPITHARVTISYVVQPDLFRGDEPAIGPTYTYSWYVVGPITDKSLSNFFAKQAEGAFVPIKGQLSQASTQFKNAPGDIKDILKDYTNGDIALGTPYSYKRNPVTGVDGVNCDFQYYRTVSGVKLNSQLPIRIEPLKMHTIAE